MLSFLRKWSGPVTMETSACPAVEHFGSIRVPSSLGENILAATPERQELREKIRSAFSTLGQEEKALLVDGPILRYALYVGDLGASERNHDRGPYGLLDHALQVAWESLKVLRGPAFRASEDPLLEYTERPVWLYGGFLLALLHDAGKVFDLDLLTPDRKTLWNPIEEPLAAFLLRHGLRGTTKEMRRYHPKRGAKRHTWLLPLVALRILPEASIRKLGPRLAWLLDGYVRAENLGREQGLQGAVGEIVAAVRHYDQKLSGESLSPNRSADKEPSERTEKAPSGSSPPKGQMESVVLGRPSGTSDDSPVPSSAESARSAASEGLFHRFSSALTIATDENRLTLNSRGALAFVGANHLYLRYPEAFALLADLMRERWAHEDPGVRNLGSRTSPAQALYGLLKEKGKLVFLDDARTSTVKATVLLPLGEREELDVALLHKEMLERPLPSFEGKIGLLSYLTGETVSVGAPPEVEVIPASPEEPGKPTESAEKNPPAAFVPAAPPPVPAKIAAPQIDRKSADKITGVNLLERLRGAMLCGELRRQGHFAEVFVRKDHTWLLYPQGFSAFAKILGASYGTAIGQFLLQEFGKHPNVDPKILVHAKISPQATTPVPLLRIHNAGFLSDGNLKDLGTWEHEIHATQGQLAWRSLGGGAEPSERKGKEAI